MVTQVNKIDTEDSKDLRILPMNLEIEQALLASLLTDNKVYERISDFLKPTHFYDKINGRIYEAVSKLIENNQLADPLTLKNYFTQKNELEVIGGDKYLIELAKNSTILSNVQDYGQRIYDLFQRREIIKISDEITNEAHACDIEKNAHEIIEKAESQLFNLSSTGETSKDLIYEAIQSSI